jgi:hypothetical protein
MHTNASISADIKHFLTTNETAAGTWTPELQLQAEALALPFLVEPICLDPSASVFRKASLINFNRHKLDIPLRRKAAPALTENSAKKLQMLMQSGPTQISTEPRFSQLAFIEEWRRNKTLADEEVLVGLGDVIRNKIKLSGKSLTPLPAKKLQFNINRRIVRTMRYESTVHARKRFHILSMHY